MTITDAELPWYADLLGGRIDAPGMARLIAEYDLVIERDGSSLWYENERRGFSLDCGHGPVRAVEAIFHLSGEDEDGERFVGPLPLGLEFEHTRADVVHRLGRADHETGPRSPDKAYGHAGILWYDLGRCWAAIKFSARSGGIRTITLNTRERAARVLEPVVQPRRPDHPRVKPTPTANYRIDVRELLGERWLQPDPVRWPVSGWRVTLNHTTSICVLPHVPTTPWPPPPLDDFVRVDDADQAARIIVTRSELTVAPTDGAERIEELVGDPVMETQTVFWVSRARYAKLDQELESLRHLPEPRVSDLPDGELAVFLTRDLLRSAAIDEYDRDLLCLPPRRDP